MAFHRMLAAPLTVVGVNLEKRHISIHHHFPVGISKEDVISGFMNRAQGFFTIRLTVPSNEAMGVATIVQTQVPATEDTDPPSPFSQTEVSVSDNGAFMTIVIMSELSAEERAMEPPPELFLYRAEETKQIVAFKLSFHRALRLAELIRASTPEALIRMVRSLDPKK